MMRLRSLCLLMLLTCAGCINPTHLQTGYVDDRDSCRSQSEKQVGVYNDSGGYGESDKDKNAALLQLFCECMKGHDWNVAGCPKPKEVAKGTPPQTIVVVQQPAAGAAAPVVVQQPAAAEPLMCPAGTVSTPVYTPKHRFIRNACVGSAPMTPAPSSPTTVFTPQNNSPDLEHIINK